MPDPERPNVGQRIRALRESRGLSLRALADRCALSINAISRIERGEASPTVASLHQIALAFGVPITDFFQEANNGTVVFTPQNQRMVVVQNGTVMQSLGIGLRHQQLEPFLITVEPGVGDLEETVTHPGQEFVYCVVGQLIYMVQDKQYELHAGDSLLFEATQPHCFSNPGDVAAQAIIVFQAPEGSHLARQRHLGGSE